MRALPILVVLLVAFAGCFGAKPAAPQEQKVIFAIADDGVGNGTVTPNNVTVAPNQLLEWHNGGKLTHRFVVDELTFAKTYDIVPGGIGQLRLNPSPPGTRVTYWHLHCMYHANMTMTVVVQA